MLVLIGAVCVATANTDAPCANPSPLPAAPPAACTSRELSVRDVNTPANTGWGEWNVRCCQRSNTPKLKGKKISSNLAFAEVTLSCGTTASWCYFLSKKGGWGSVTREANDEVHHRERTLQYTEQSHEN